MSNRFRESRGDRYGRGRNENRNFGRGIEEGYGYSPSRGDQYSDRNNRNEYSDKDMNEDRYRTGYDRDQREYRETFYGRGGRSYSDNDQYHSGEDQYSGRGYPRNQRDRGSEGDYSQRPTRYGRGESQYRNRRNESEQRPRYSYDEEYSDQEHSTFDRSSRY